MSNARTSSCSPDLVAYFSMEIGLDPAMPTYSGGLGMLAGDLLRAAADEAIPMVGVTLLHRKGYFRQHLDASGWQTEEAETWSPEAILEPLPARATVQVEGRTVHVRAWRFTIKGASGHEVPVYLLDTALPENDPRDQALTDSLYGGDARYRLAQEIVLGPGGVAMLDALGHGPVPCFHLNEGHSALLALALLETLVPGRPPEAVTVDDLLAVRRRCVFTTHTPVPAGHDKFPRELVEEVLGPDRSRLLEQLGCCRENELNMTYLGLFFSRFVNGVSMRHEEISEDMFPSYPINAVTNGVHAGTWTVPSFQALYDRHMPEWRRDSLYLRYAVGIPSHEVLAAHAEAKLALFHVVKERTGIELDPRVLTLGFARRATPYKRPELLFGDVERLKRMARDVGPLQIVYAGKAHPRDDNGKALIQRIHQAAAALKDTVNVVYVENYDMALGRLITSGVDLWVNTPQKPHEASGTSGMKAAVNGVPSLSVLDGWWIEGHVEGVTGWAVDESWRARSDSGHETVRLLDKLEYLIMPMFYGRPTAYARVMRGAIALNGSFFNAQRMVKQYVNNAYRSAADR